MAFTITHQRPFIVSAHNADDLRNEQADAARQMAAAEGESTRPVLTVQRTHEPRHTRAYEPAPRRPAAPAPRVPLKGHEAFLKALEMSGADVVIEKISTGAQVHGKIKHSDKYTVTLRTIDLDGMTIDRVIYKHDISEFFTTTPRPDVEYSATIGRPA